ncbi:MAG: ABC transporter substrate-binding protein [Holosporaceae bacterium]|jgi:trehalose/maltose transport system substrate-binding protein|nr:ABC transporter substrate-binding protein [Holosporaceae bacterium]
MKKYLKFLAVAAAVALGTTSCLQAAVIKITCRSKGRELEVLRKAIDEWMEKQGGKHKVEIVTLPHASNECFALYQQWFGAETFDVDVLQVDVAWVGIFSDYLLPLDEYCADHLDMDDYFDIIKENMCSEDGHIIALPIYTDCGMMYYRSDLLEKYSKPVPKTLEEMYETALYIQNEERKDEEKKNKFYGLVLQAKAFEILTCNFAEILDACGGAIVKNNAAEINSERGMYAIDFMVKCLKNIMSHSVLNYSEEDARGIFQSGNAVFMRNWPYAYALMNDPSTAVAGKFDVMTIPPSAVNGKESGALGGWFMAVSKYSKHKELAADLAMFVTSKAQQKIRVAFSYLPTFKSLYKDPEVLKMNPFVANMQGPLLNAVARPSRAFGKNYTKASSEIFNTINTILTESVENTEDFNAGKHMERLNKKLSSLLHEKQQKKATDPADSASKPGFFRGIMNSIAGFFGKR